MHSLRRPGLIDSRTALRAMPGQSGEMPADLSEVREPALSSTAGSVPAPVDSKHGNRFLPCALSVDRTGLFNLEKMEGTSRSLPGSHHPAGRTHAGTSTLAKCDGFDHRSHPSTPVAFMEDARKPGPGDRGLAFRADWISQRSMPAGKSTVKVPPSGASDERASFQPDRIRSN